MLVLQFRQWIRVTEISPPQIGHLDGMGYMLVSFFEEMLLVLVRAWKLRAPGILLLF